MFRKIVCNATQLLAHPWPQSRDNAYIIVCNWVHRILIKQLCRAHGLIHNLRQSSISNPNTQQLATRMFNGAEEPLSKNWIAQKTWE